MKVSMSKKALKFGTTIAGSLLTASSLATTVADGYSELALNHSFESVDTDFNSLSVDQINDNMSIFNLTDTDTESGSGSGTSCHNDYKFYSLYCAEQYGISFVDDGDSGEALKVEGHRSEAVVTAADGTVLSTSDIYGARTIAFGTTANFGPLEEDPEVRRLLQLLGLSPGAIPEASNMPEDPSIIPPLSPITNSFTSSVDFKVEADPFGHESKQRVALGAAIIEIVQPVSGNGSINFYVPKSSTLGENRTLLDEFSVELSEAFPTESWFTFDVSYDADLTQLTMTVSAKGGSSFNTIVHTVSDVYPRLLALPLVAGVNVTDIHVVDDFSADRYESAIVVDNYVSSEQQSAFRMNLSPLTFNGNDYVADPNFNYLYFLESTYVDVNGNLQLEKAFPIFQDGHKLPSSIDGTVGNNLNITLVSSSWVDDGVTVTSYMTMIHPFSQEEFMEIFSDSDLTVDMYYENALVAQGATSDYLVAGAEVSPEQALLDMINHNTVDLLYLDYQVGLRSNAANSIIEYKSGADGVLGTSDDVVFTSSDEIDALPFIGPAAMSQMFDYSSTWEASTPPSQEPLLVFLNSAQTTLELLDDEVGLRSNAASNLIAHRNGPDGILGTDDDDLFESRTEVDMVPQIGPAALEDLDTYVENL